MLDKRKFERRKVRETVSVSWLDRQGAKKFYSTNCFDVSPEGLSVQIGEPLKNGSYVGIRSGKLKLVARAVVKSCVQRGGFYRIGLEFARQK